MDHEERTQACLFHHKTRPTQRLPLVKRTSADQVQAHARSEPIHKQGRQHQVSVRPLGTAASCSALIRSLLAEHAALLNSERDTINAPARASSMISHPLRTSEQIQIRHVGSFVNGRYRAIRRQRKALRHVATRLCASSRPCNFA
ncbi:hypothetical protein F2P81_001275 [Scophthalmus maximus]|uniref:Uncharacterized protein n=1 Tax=Scophthalmus maximus TaxID=52904 RepID=A0A6A4U017_SCOMX|nr:hypothetical protein F2P81_001275 [Scophthalmus maximus]